MTLSLDDEIYATLASFDHADYFVGSAISDRKLQSSISFHGVSLDDDVFAVIDATVFGSAENGMSITATGIYWKNDWTTKTRISSLTWDELSSISHQIKAIGRDVVFATGVQFNTLGMKPPHVVAVIKAMVNLYERYGMIGEEAAQKEVPASSSVPVGTKVLLATSVPNDSGYADSLGRYLAIIACHGGTADAACVDLALELLSAEEGEHPGGLEAFSAAIETLEGENARSATFFKLRIAKLLTEVKQLSVEYEERITIMCEAVTAVSNAPSAALALTKVQQVIARH